MKMNKLTIDHLSKTFTNGGQSVEVLDDLSLHVKDGEFVTLIGPSGSGKSTIFHLVGGLIQPSSGRILIDEKDVTGEKGNISYMPQQNSLFPWRTVLENVVLAQELNGHVDKQKAVDWLKKGGLDGYEEAYPATLSGGMQQRVAFIRALLSPRDLMCLDEPFGSLDELTRLDMQQWLLNIWGEHQRSVLFVTHSIEEALMLSDRIYVLSSKPTRLIKEMTIPFGRPREHPLSLDPTFLELKQQIYHLMKT